LGNDNLAINSAHTIITGIIESGIVPEHQDVVQADSACFAEDRYRKTTFKRFLKAF
jgi:hypothetical protein